MRVHDNYLKVEITYEADPLQNSTEIVRASKVARTWPNLGDIVTHPDFRQLSYTVELTKVEITWHSDHVYDDGQPSKEYEGPIPVPF